MAVGIGTVVVRLPVVTGKTEDGVENVFNFHGDFTGDHVGDLNNVMDRLEDFYNFDHAGAVSSLATWLAPQLSRGAGQAKMLGYFTDDLTGGTPLGSPDVTRSWTLGAGAADEGLPAEVAAVLSFKGDTTDVPETAGATKPAARRRGRVYIGPLIKVSAASATASDPVYLDDDLVAALVASGEALLAANDDLVWTVWSKTGGAQYPVVSGHVDNAFDIQRRRGVEWSTRTNWS